MAEFHDKKLHHVNEAINNNKDKFREEVDYVDVKDYKKIVIDFIDNEILTQNSINRSNNIYLVSQRGYFKIKTKEDRYEK